jgi:hypothetical protein
MSHTQNVTCQTYANALKSLRFGTLGLKLSREESVMSLNQDTQHSISHIRGENISDEKAHILSMLEHAYSVKSPTRNSSGADFGSAEPPHQ